MPVNYKAKQICLYKSCSPCEREIINGKKCNNNKCLLDIYPDLVLKELKSILKL